MTAGRRPLRPSRADQLAQLHETLVQAVEALVADDAWQRMLDLAAHLPHYSLANVLLIRAQCPDATFVMGYRAWAQHDRHVLKGQKGIAILAPCMYPVHDDERPGPEADPGDESEAGRRTLRGYRVVHVFDVSQTAGAELRRLPTTLPGQAPPLLAEHLSELVLAAGFQLEEGDCGTANGYTDFAARRVRIRKGMPPAQAVKTLAHELGHIRAAHEHRFLDPATRRVTCRGVAEVEAESIAYLLVTSAGLDSSAYSVPYIAEWGDGVDLVRQTATTVLTVATGIQNELVASPPARRSQAATVRAAQVAAHQLDGLEALHAPAHQIPDPTLSV